MGPTAGPIACLDAVKPEIAALKGGVQGARGLDFADAQEGMEFTALI